MAQKVYVVTLREEYNGAVENDLVVGVFSTEEKAQEVLERKYIEMRKGYRKEKLEEYDYKSPNGFQLEDCLCMSYAVTADIVTRWIDEVVEA